MKLKHCVYGVLVQDNKERRIGMVVGITNSSPCSDITHRSNPTEARPLVCWADGSTHAIHQGNIKLYNGGL